VFVARCREIAAVVKPYPRPLVGSSPGLEPRGHDDRLSGSVVPMLFQLLANSHAAVV
jgi:hypothetical protein